MVSLSLSKETRQLPQNHNLEQRRERQIGNTYIDNCCCLSRGYRAKPYPKQISDLPVDSFLGHCRRIEGFFFSHRPPSAFPHTPRRAVFEEAGRQKQSRARHTRKLYSGSVRGGKERSHLPRATGAPMCSRNIGCVFFFGRWNCPHARPGRPGDQKHGSLFFCRGRQKPSAAGLFFGPSQGCLLSPLVPLGVASIGFS